MVPGGGASGQRSKRRVAVGKTLLIAGACAVVPLVGNVVASFVTTWTAVASWLVVPAVGVGVAMLTALIQAYGSASARERPPPRPAPYPPSRPGPYPPSRPGPYPPSPVRRRGMSLPIALLTAVLVIGVGGLAATEGIRYAVGYATGNEPGTSRLAQPASASTGGLTVTVESVTYTAHFTQVGVAARNETGESLSLPLFGFCVFTGSEGTTLEADPSRSHWSTTLAPGSLQRGVIIFPGHLPDSVLQASFSFTQIFSLGGGSITVRPIDLTPT